MRNLPSILRLTLMICTALTIGGCFNNPKRYRILIPENFSGTAYIYYNVREAEQLKLEEGYKLIVIPDNGIARTSSEPMPGKFHDEYWLYSGKTRTRMSPYKLGGGGTVERTNEHGQHEIFSRFNVLKEERPH